MADDAYEGMNVDDKCQNISGRKTPQIKLRRSDDGLFGRNTAERLIDQLLVTDDDASYHD